MRTEEEIRQFRTDWYRTTVMLKQQGTAMAAIMPMFIELLDWTLGEHDFDLGHLSALLDKLDEDKKKLALF